MEQMSKMRPHELPEEAYCALKRLYDCDAKKTRKKDRKEPSTPAATATLVNMCLN